MKPAPLRFGLRKHLGQRGPEAERAVPDGKHRGAHAAPGAIAQQIGPGFGRFAVAVGERDEFLAAVGAHSDQHQQAEFVLLEPDVDVVKSDRGAVPVFPWAGFPGPLPEPDVRLVDASGSPQVALGLCCLFLMRRSATGMGSWLPGSGSGWSAPCRG
ncbi:hypothetical protein GCM10023334_103300 [Nonomuraea thailandensis]